MKPSELYQLRAKLRMNPFVYTPFPTVKIILAVLFLTCILSTARAQGSYSLTSLFSVPAGTGNIVSSANNRGLAYDVVSNLVYVSSSGGSIGAYNGTNGAYLGAFNTTGLSGGTYAIDQIGVAADGAIYAVDLAVNSGSPNKIYRWPSWNSTYTTAFSGNALVNGSSLSYTSGRIGDTLAVTGSGTNTLILAGVGGQPYFSLFYTADGLNFTNTVIDVPTGLTVPNNIYGLCFYTNNTFLIKPYGTTNSTVYVIQYPTNYASQTVVTGAVVASSSLGAAYNNFTFLTYAPAANLIGTITTGGTTSPVGLFSATNIAAGITTLATASQSTPTVPGNSTGGAALGGKGLTNVLYVINTGNPLQAYSVAFSSAPIIASFNGGITNAFPPQTLTASVSGAAPLSYEWYAISGGVTNPIVDNTNFYTVTTGGTNLYYFVVTNSYGAATSSIVGLSLYYPVTNSTVSQLWRIAAGSSGYPFLGSSGDSTRGMAYDAVSGHVVVATTSGSIYLLDGNTGTNLGTLPTTGLPLTGQFAIDQLGVADDGAAYACNLVTGNGQNFYLYRWSSPTTTTVPAVAYNDSNSSILHNEGSRWGDTMAVRGSGINTQIILGSRAGTNVALLTTTDGINFNATIIAITNITAGFAQNGISFGAGNTLWAKAVIGPLYEIAFDPVNQVGGVVLSYQNPTKIPSYQIGVAVDPTNNILAGVDASDVNNDVKLYQLTGTSDAPVLFAQSFFASANANGNYFAPITIKYPRLYALDVNNGIVALTYGVPAATVPSIITPPSGQTAFATAGTVTFSVGASGSVPLYYQWRLNSNNISGATSSTYAITNPPLSSAGYYDVVVHNIAGSVTSTPPALLTLLTPVVSTVVTQLWTLAPGSIPAISDFDGSSYGTRGLAYDTNTSTVILADHNNIYLLAATNGSYLGQLNMLGVPTSGLNSWLVDQVGVADDGVLYSCNLTTTGPGFSIVQWANIGVNQPGTAYAYPAGSSSGGDPGNGSGDRWGDTMAVRGAGTSTEILVGSYSGTNVVLFTTTDGSSFTPTLIAITNVPAGFSGLGIAFGAGNTFWADGGSTYNLRQLAFDPVGAVGGAVQSFTAGSQAPYNFTGLSVDVASNVLAGVNFSDSPNDLQLYLLSGNTNAPSLANQSFFGSNNANSQQNAVSVLKGGLGFGLDVNNGVVAISYGTPSAPGVVLTSVSYSPGNVTINWNNAFSNHDYQVQYKNSLLDPAWTNLGSPVTATGATGSYNDTTASGTTRFYRVVTQ
jgi:hypothetical protein